MPSLRTTLRLNAVSCFLFGTAFLLSPVATAEFLGAAPSAMVELIGALLLVNGIHLSWASRRAIPHSLEIYYFSSGDLLWVTLTLALASSGTVITTTTGTAVSLLVALLVGTLGVLQVVALNRSTPALQSDDHLPNALSSARAIASSWLSMKRWVKYWLVALNALFLCAIAFWPDDLAKIILAAYVASGPWLILIIVRQRGLTRFLGVAHLIPWVPLVVYLVARLATQSAGPQLVPSADPLAFGYVLTLLVALCVCLIFDIADAWRWFRGERYRLGSVNAHRVGASGAWQ